MQIGWNNNIGQEEGVQFIRLIICIFYFYTHINIVFSLDVLQWSDLFLIFVLIINDAITSSIYSFHQKAGYNEGQGVFHYKYLSVGSVLPLGVAGRM